MLGTPSLSEPIWILSSSCKLWDLDQQVSADLEEIKTLPVHIYQVGIPDCS